MKYVINVKKQKAIVMYQLLPKRRQEVLFYLITSKDFKKKNGAEVKCSRCDDWFKCYSTYKRHLYEKHTDCFENIVFKTHHKVYDLNYDELVRKFIEK